MWMQPPPSSVKKLQFWSCLIHISALWQALWCDEVPKKNTWLYLIKMTQSHWFMCQIVHVLCVMSRIFVLLFLQLYTPRWNLYVVGFWYFLTTMGNVFLSENVFLRNKSFYVCIRRHVLFALFWLCFDDILMHQLTHHDDPLCLLYPALCCVVTELLSSLTDLSCLPLMTSVDQNNVITTWNDLQLFYPNLYALLHTILN